MLDHVAPLFSQDFIPHGHCYYWRPGLLWLHVGSDALIALAYFSIPLALLFYMRRRPQVKANGIFALFAAFILFCGATHLFHIVTVWHPYYYIEGGIKAATATVSGFTAVALWYLMPMALRIPTSDELQAANDELQRENRSRRQAEQELQRVNEHLEQLVEQRTRELEQFVYASSHDLQEPLRHMRCYVGFLRKDLPDQLGERATEDVRFIEDAAERMGARVEALLALSRVNRDTLSVQRVWLPNCIGGAVEDLRGLIEASGAKLGPAPQISVYADPRLLSVVFHNLISNSLKYARGEPRIEFVAEHRPGEVEFGVKDNGIGVAAADRETIFRPFGRLHSYDQVPGSGIGLSLVRTVAERHGGHVGVESRPGEGAYFWVVLPQGDGDNE